MFYVINGKLFLFVIEGYAYVLIPLHIGQIDITEIREYNIHRSGRNNASITRFEAQQAHIQWA